MHAAVLYTYLMPAQRHPLLSFLWEQEQLPYEASALRQRLAGNDTAELQVGARMGRWIRVWVGERACVRVCCGVFYFLRATLGLAPCWTY